jgi:hypothetical protein
MMSVLLVIAFILLSEDACRSFRAARQTRPGHRLRALGAPAKTGTQNTTAICRVN